MHEKQDRKIFKMRYSTIEVETVGSERNSRGVKKRIKRWRIGKKISRRRRRKMQQKKGTGQGKKREEREGKKELK